MIKITVFGKVCVILLLFCMLLSAPSAMAQGFIKTLGAGLSTGVSCSCTDTSGNLYAVVWKNLDTTIVNRWDTATGSWSEYARFYVQAEPKTCQFLFGKFYLGALDPSSSLDNVVNLWEYNGTWTNKGSFNFRTGLQYIDYHMASVRFKNRLFLAGNFDSSASVFKKEIIAYNGTGFVSVGALPAGSERGKPSFAVMGDSLFLMMGNSVFLFNGSNAWSLYHTTNSIFYYYNTMAVNNHLLYITSGLEINIVKNGVKIDSINYFTSGHLSLATHNKKVFVKNGRGGNNGIYQIENRKDLAYIFNNELDDTAYQPLLSGNGQLYYHPSAGVKVNGKFYGYIVRLGDSIVPVKFDTIVGYVFWDKNNNLKKDGGDVAPYNGAIRNMKGNYTIALNPNTGVFRDIVPENSAAEYRIMSANYDSCVKTYFSGDIRARNTDTGITTDSVYIPMSKLSSRYLNLVVNSQNGSRARLTDTVTLKFNIRHEDCSNAGTNNVSLVVRLDTNAHFVSASPGLASVTGNVYTFTGLTVNYGVDNPVQIRVVYPISKLSIGDKVRHYARLGNISGEDSTGNQDSLIQRMTYSYDPNSKHSEPEGRITSDLKTIKYTIDFQNLGNDNAIKVTVIDTLNLKMPVYEFRMLGASHNYSVSIVPGTSVVVWTFDKINLLPKSVNELASRGQIVFQAKVRGDLRVGDSICNRAYIYFDYNSPVVTNYAVVNRVDNSGSIRQEDAVTTVTMKLFPNPAHSEFKLMNLSPADTRFRIYDVKGALITDFRVIGNTEVLVNVGGWAPGIYNLINDKGDALKFMIE